MYCGTSVDKNGIIKNAIKALCAKVKIFFLTAHNNTNVGNKK